jgi:hypothetical protein
VHASIFAAAGNGFAPGCSLCATVAPNRDKVGIPLEFNGL